MDNDLHNEFKILSEKEIQNRLSSLPGWHYKNNKISKELKFEDFMDSLNFVNRLAVYCQQLDHHPDIFIFYNKVLFELQRKDVGGKVTDKDFMVARKIEMMYIQKHNQFQEI